LECHRPGKRTFIDSRVGLEGRWVPNRKCKVIYSHLDRLVHLFFLGKGFLVGGGDPVVVSFGQLKAVLQWSDADFSPLDPQLLMRQIIPAAVFLTARLIASCRQLCTTTRRGLGLFLAGITNL